MSVGSHPGSVITAVSRNKAGTGQTLSKYSWVGLLTEKGPQPRADLCGPPLLGEWGWAAACSITAGKIDVALKLPQCLEPGAPPAGYTASQVQGFLKLQESLCPGQLPTQTPCHHCLPSLKEFKPRLKTHWTSCKKEIELNDP